MPQEPGKNDITYLREIEIKYKKRDITDSPVKPIRGATN